MIDLTDMNLVIGVLAGSQLEQQIRQGACIHQLQAVADREFPSIVWHQYGLIATDEIAVTACCAELGYFIRAASQVIHPPMADRVFAMDVLDAQLGESLAERLWTIHGNALRARAGQRQRDGSTSRRDAQ